MPKHSKVVIIGLDGATFNILRPLVGSGVMPTVGRFMQEGAWGNLLSTRPPVTCPAWPSMFTGVGPGKHGVFSFSHRDTTTGRVRTAAVTDIRAPKLWDLVGQSGLRSAVMNVPITFPAQPMEGATITGFVSPDDSDLVSYPKSLAAELREEFGDLKLNWLVLGYRPSNRERRNAHVREINELMQLRVQQFEYILDKNSCDLCYLVHEYPDRVYHLYHHILDPAFPAHSNPENASTLELLRTGHQVIDDSIKRLMQRFGPQANYMIVSDHGFGGVTKWLYLNNLLANCGLTRFRTGRLWTELLTRHMRIPSRMREWLGVESQELWHKKDPSCALMIDFSQSKAFGGPQLEHSVYVNLEGKHPDGNVALTDYHRVCGAIVDALRGARDPENGRRVFQGVWTRDELFHGPHVEHAPDVIYELAPGYMVSNSFLPNCLLRGGFLRPLRAGWDISGYHRPEGVFLGWGPAFAKIGGLEASILDITPTVLYLMNIAIPEYMDGKVILGAIKPDMLHDQTLRTHPVSLNRAETYRIPYSEAEQVEVNNRLEELGYL